LTSPKFLKKDSRDLLLSTVFFIVSYAPSPFGFFIYIAFIPLLIISRRNDPGRAFILGYLTGLLINTVTLYWLFFYSGTGFSVIAFGNALQFGILTGLLSWSFKKTELFTLFLFPVLWTFLEYIRQFGDLAFTWLNIAHTQSYFLYLIQYVEYTGYLGVVFWICIVNLTIYLTIKSANKSGKLFRHIVIIAILFLLPLVFGFYKMGLNNQVRGISVAYVQPNIDPDEKWSDEFLHDNLSALVSLTDSILITKPDLVVWPETGIPYYLRNYPDELELIQNHVRENKYYLIAGTLDYKISNLVKHKYNAAFFFNPNDKNIGIYHKLQLVPEEEKFPYKDYLPEWLIGKRESDMSRGREAVAFKISTQQYQLRYGGEDWRVISKDRFSRTSQLSVVICYESIFPNLVQKSVEKEAELLIIITNDGWFGYTSQPFQHSQAAVYRALEQRVSIVRCANTGISSFIDPYGRRYEESGLFNKKLAQKIIPLRREQTFYSIYGDWLGIFCGILLFSYLTLLATGLIWKGK
jgi:apolipoprotein N-acyltransferase